MPTRQGSIHLFRFSGIDLYLHWSWFVVAVYEIRGGLGTYTSVTWNILEYLALFLIVTLHEFGHALACRQVHAGCPLTVAVGLAHQPGPANFQYAAYLSAGWRADSSLVALVCAGTRPQPAGGRDLRLHRRGRVHRTRFVDSIRVVWNSWRLHAHELLGRTAACAGAAALRQAAAPERICVSGMQDRAAGRGTLEVRAVRTGIRYVPDRGGVSALRDAVSGDQVPGLREGSPHERVGGGSGRLSEILNTGGGKKYRASRESEIQAHQPSFLTMVVSSSLPLGRLTNILSPSKRTGTRAPAPNS